MPESDNSSSKEPVGGEALQAFSDLLLKNEDFRKSAGAPTIWLLLFLPWLSQN
jgi:hypothetical protein